MNKNTLLHEHCYQKLKREEDKERVLSHRRGFGLKMMDFKSILGILWYQHVGIPKNTNKPSQQIIFLGWGEKKKKVQGI